MDDTESILLKKYNDLIWGNLNITNSYRAKNLSVFLSVILALLFLMDYSNKSRGLWANHGYVLLFYSHVIFILMLLIFIFIYSYNKEKHSSKFYTYYIIAFSIFILNITGFTSGWIDQQIHGEITVYSMGCFVIAIILYLKPKYIILFHAQSYLLFIICLIINQKNSAILQGDLINSFIIISLACYISFTISKLMQREYLHKFELEEAINRLQQYNLIGEMSAGIAHEIRNPMSAVRGFLQLLEGKDYYKKDKHYFDLMIAELDRANSIISDFLSISKDKKYKLENKNLNNIASKLIPLLNTSSKYILTSELGQIPELLLDENEICQVILNLANNGLEAMPDGGCLTIKTYKEDDKVILEVQDEGEGIKPELIERIGTPFFTTKENGTGLGLAVCSNIIKRHNAKMKIGSDSHGSNFQVIFDIPP